jgi:predicted  nucleic acid-binding Zn-ribbon protein
MTHFRRPADEAREVRSLRQQLVELASRVERLEIHTSTLDDRLEEVEWVVTDAVAAEEAAAAQAEERGEEQAAPTRAELPPPLPRRLFGPPLVAPPLTGSPIDELHATADDHARRLREMEESIRRLSVARTDPEHAAFQRRLDLLAAQLRTLATQSAELRTDAEVLRRMIETSPGVDPIAFEELRSHLARLAQEQARMELAFREDLAMLADRLRQRPPLG